MRFSLSFRSISRVLTPTIRSNRSVKPWSRTPDGFAFDGARAIDERPYFHLHWDSGQSGDRDPWRVGTMWSVGQQRKGISRRGEHPRLACLGVVQPPRWWISGNTDAVWLALEGGCPTDRSSTA